MQRGEARGARREEGIQLRAALCWVEPLFNELQKGKVCGPLWECFSAVCDTLTTCEAIQEGVYELVGGLRTG